jgi:hypothetical protein
MLPGNEHLIPLSELTARQILIYNDAGDRGLKLNNELKTQIRNHLVPIIRMYKGKVTKHANGNSDTSVVIPYEQDGSITYCYQLNVHFQKIKKHPSLIRGEGEYLSIELFNTTS